MSKFKVGEVVTRIEGTHNGCCVGHSSRVIGLDGFGGIILEDFSGVHAGCKFELAHLQPSAAQQRQIKGETAMNKTIIIPQKAITKIIFLYDNGKKHHAAKIKKFNAATKDIDGTECIEYSNHTGAHRVYRDDLAAITFICEDGYTTTQKLMDKVVVEADNARMYKKAR